MPAFICTACGAQFTPGEEPPAQCPTCEDERQYVPSRGQTWMTLPALAASHFNSYREHAPGVIGIGTQPAFAIGQRALLLRTAAGNVLWDSISLVDAPTVTLLRALGGIKAIAISHPHFYTAMVQWSRAFGGVPIHLHAADRAWIMRPDPAVRLWEGDTLALMPGVTLVRCGGHFPGGTVLHWAEGAGWRAVLGRHRCDRSRPQIRELHEELPQFHPALRRRGRSDRGGPCPVRVRHHLQALFRPGDPDRRQSGGRRLGGAISCRHPRPAAGLIVADTGNTSIPRGLKQPTSALTRCGPVF
jgi:hypothetical protein